MQATTDCKRVLGVYMEYKAERQTYKLLEYYNYLNKQLRDIQIEPGQSQLSDLKEMNISSKNTDKLADGKECLSTSFNV